MKINSYLFALLLPLFAFGQTARITEIDSLVGAGRTGEALRMLQNGNFTGPDQVKALFITGKIQLRNQHYKGALKTGVLLIKQCKAKTDSLHLFYTGRGYELKGHARFFLRDFEKSLLLLDSANLLFRKSNSLRNLGYNFNMMGTIAYLNREYSKAIALQAEALQVLKNNPSTTNDELMEVRIDLANVYQQTHDYQGAARIIEDGLKLKGLQKSNRADALNNLGMAYHKLKEGQKAKDAYRMALGLYFELGAPENLAKVYNNLGSLEDEVNEDPKQAKFYLRQALVQYQIAGFTPGTHSALLNLGGILLKQDSLYAASSLLITADSMAVEQGDLDVHIMAMEFMSQVEAKQGNYKRAFELLTRVNQIKDSTNNLEEEEKTARMKALFEVNAQREQIEALEEEKEELGSKKSQITWLLGSLLAVLVGLLALLYFWYEQRKRVSNQMLKLAERDKQLAVTASLIQGQEEERNRISREIHDGLGTKVTLLLHQYGESMPEEMRRNMVEVSREIREISHDLMPGVLLKFGLADALEELVSQWQSSDRVQFETNIERMAPFPFEINEQLLLYRIVQELIKNAIQHGKATFISVHLFKEGQDFVISLEDNGLGMPQTTTKGLGLANIEKRINYLNGLFSLRSDEEGTHFLIRIPLP